jgi:hypothetical protein
MAGPKVANFNSPGVPYASERADLAMEQALLLQALQQQSQAGYSRPGIRSSNVFTPDLGGLGSAIAANMNREKVEINRKKAADLEGRYNEEMVKELRKYRTAESGETVNLEGPTEDGRPLTGRVPGDPQAYKGFVDSPYPEVAGKAKLAQELYQKQFEELAKRASFPSIQQTIQSGQQSIGQLAPKRDMVPLEGALIDTTEGKDPSVVPSTRVVQATLPSGTVVNQFASGKQSSVDTAPRMTTNVQNMPGNEVLKGRIAKLEEGQETALKQVDTLRATEQALTALQAGATTGFGAEWLQNLRTAATMLTGVQFPENTPTAVLQKALAENVVNKFSGKLGTGVSNADVLFMGKASGDLATDAKAIEQILAIQAAAAQRGIAQHNKLAESISPYIDKTLGEGITRELYTVPWYQPKLKFSTPEAAASYEAGITGKNYPDTVNEVKQYNADYAKGKKPTDESAIKKRMEELGLPYIPPAKGK